VGGVTYSECREMHLAAARHGTTLVLGSTQLLTPQRFIRELKGLKDLEADLRI
jgi:syntaxin-binding protein 1